MSAKTGYVVVHTQQMDETKIVTFLVNPLSGNKMVITQHLN